MAGLFAEAVIRAESVLGRGKNAVAAQGLPDPVDVFAAIYDVLEAEASYMRVHADFLDATRDPARLSHGEAVFRQNCALISADAEQIGMSETLASELVSILAALRRHGASPLAISGLVRAARAIDVVFSGIQLRGGTSLLSRLQPFQDRLARQGNLMRDKDGGGIVLPMSRVGLTGNTLRQLFANLVRIPSAMAVSVDYALLPLIGRASRGGHLRLGVAPVVVNADEVVWSRGEGATFAVSLASGRFPDVIGRLLETLEWMAEARVDVVVLPELVSSGPLRDAVQAWMRRPGRPGLVLAGTEAVAVGSNRPVNRAFVIGRSGMAWTQDKNHRYTFSDSGIQAWQLAAELGQGPLDEESYSDCRTVRIRDIPGVGRCIVLICQDLSQDEPGRAVVINAGADLVLAPVMDTPAQVEPWISRSALDLANDPRATTVVANSYALLSRATHGIDRLNQGDYGALGVVRGARGEEGFPLCLAVYTAGAGSRPLGAIYGIP